MKTEYFTSDHAAEITDIKEDLIKSFHIAANNEENGNIKKGELVISHYKDQESNDLMTSVVGMEKLSKAFRFAPSLQIAQDSKPRKGERWKVAGMGVLTSKGIVM